MKVKGALWKQFYNDEAYWQDYYHDDTFVTFDGVEQDDYENPADDAVVEVEYGYVYRNNYISLSHDLTLATFFKRWKKLQGIETIVVTVDKDYAKSVKDEIRQLEGVKGVK